MDQRANTELSADIPAALAGYAISQPDNAAILAPGRPPLSFAALYAQQEYVRKSLSEHGISRGDPVAVLLPKGPEMAVAMAVLPASATAVPLNWKLTAEEYTSLFQRCSVRALLVPRGMEHAARDAARRDKLCQIELLSDVTAPAGSFELAFTGVPKERHGGHRLGPEIAYIVGTSGTTSRPKLLPYPHLKALSYAQAVKGWLGLNPTDRNIHLVPMYFAHGVKTALMVPLLCGASVVCPPDYQVDLFFSLLDEFRPTWFSAGFTLHRDVLKHAERYKPSLSDSRLRFVRATSGRLEPDEIERVEKLFCAPVIIGLSSSETDMLACNPLPPRRRKAGSVGLPVASEVRIRDPAGRFVEPGQEGEIVARGPLIFDGYLDDPAASRAAFVDGWYRTGDLGRFDADGYLYLTGRIKEVINCGGEKISPAQVDRIIRSHPAVADAAAFGLPHPTLGEVVVAAVVLDGDTAISESAIIQHARAHLAYLKIPRKIFFVDRLPRAENGKLERYKLSDTVASAAASPGKNPDR